MQSSKNLNKCLSESLLKTSNIMSDNERIVLKSMSKLVLEDIDFFKGLIGKLTIKTKLSRNIVRESLQKIRKDGTLDKIKIGIIAEEL